MTEFLLALFVFLFAHILPQIGDLRGRIIALTSRKIYIIGYSILSTALLVWLISAALSAPKTVYYAADPTTVRIAMGLMLVAVILFVMGASRPNSLSVSFRRNIDMEVDKPRDFGTGAPSDHRRVWIMGLRAHNCKWRAGEHFVVRHHAGILRTWYDASKPNQAEKAFA